MKKWIALLLALVMIFSMTACGGEEESGKDKKKDKDDRKQTEEVTEPEPTGTTLETPLWTLVYNEADGWIVDPEDVNQEDAYSSAIIAIPNPEDEEYDLINVEIQVSVETAAGFRDLLDGFGFDAYEYVVNHSYELVNVGGVECLIHEDEYWGFPCLRYFNRVEGAAATVFVEIVGDYEDERVPKLLEGLSFHLPDLGNEDAPWYWEGTPFSAEDSSAMAGTFTLSSQWIPFNECVITAETFDHTLAVTGGKAYIISEGTLKQYAFDGTSLVYETDIELDGEFENIAAAKDGTLWLGGFMTPLIGWKDGVQTASYSGPDSVAMHPDGTWGISYYSSPECAKYDISGGTYVSEPLTFSQIDTVSRVMVDEHHIYACGYTVDDGAFRVYVYDHNGNLQMILSDGEGGGLGSITFMAETPHGFIGLDGNMRTVILWDKEGACIGEIDDRDLFGTSYPWFCDAVMLEDGSILVIMTEERADESAMELVAFKLSGF